MKILVSANDDRILGFTMIGSEAGEVMAVVQTAIIAGLLYTRLRDAVLTHPTMAEGLGFLLASVERGPGHSTPTQAERKRDPSDAVDN
jgi:Pyridine nucleotide-disulphide oxidoreductase, dimerisation domain